MCFIEYVNLISINSIENLVEVFFFKPFIGKLNCSDNSLMYQITFSCFHFPRLKRMWNAMPRITQSRHIA